MDKIVKLRATAKTIYPDEWGTHLTDLMRGYLVIERHYVDLPPAEYFKLSGNLSAVINRTLA